MTEANPYPLYEKGLAFLRTRLLGAVLMPALIGAALSARQGQFHWLRFVLIMVGLAAAELLNLFGSDYQTFRNPRKKDPQLPGNPVIAPSLLPPSRIPIVLVPIALIGLAVLIYFTLTVGIAVLVFLVAAGIIGALYVFSPFRYAFLYTAFIPPLISGGVFLALTGKAEGVAFAAGLPITLISLAVILGYRVMYERIGAQRRRTRAVVLAVYCLTGINVILYVVAAIYPLAGLAALLPIVLFFWLFANVSEQVKTDPVPATAVGVFMHTGTSLAIAAALLFG
jgi:hypothetical protein